MRIAIFMASTILGGPGKGLVQFLECGGMEKVEPTVIGFRVRGTTDETEFGKTLKRTGAPYLELFQKSRLDWGLVRQAADIVREQGIDMVQSHGYKSHLLCLLLKLRTGIPWVAFAHGWTAENYRMRLYNLLDRLILPFADAVVPVSHSIERILGNGVRGKCTVIHNAVRQDESEAVQAPGAFRERFGIPEGHLVLAAVGRMSPEKGQVFLLEGLAKARETIAPVRLLLVGDGQDRAMLERKVAELGLEAEVIFTGYLKEMTEVYGVTDCLVLPSLSEGIPNVALEAMAHGIPVLATEVGGVPEVVRHEGTGILIPSGDADRMAQGLIRMCGDRERMREYGRNGRERVEAHFSPYERVNAILRVYDNVLKGRAS